MLTPGLHAFKLLSILFILFSQGENGKMSASDPNSAIYVTDTAKEIKNKVYSVLYFGIVSTDIHCLVGRRLSEY